MPKTSKPGPFPKEDAGNFGAAAAKGTLKGIAGLVPVVGGPLGEIIDRVIVDPLRKRQEAWLDYIGEGLEELQDRFEGFDPAHLDTNEEFLSTVAQATAQATRTHQRDKLAALRAAVLNTAIGVKLDEVVRARFLALIDQYSPLHLRTLRLLSEPKSSTEMFKAANKVMMGSFDTVLAAGLGDVSASVRDVVVADLARDGLIQGGIKAMQSGGSLLDKRSTQLGDELLRFITDPSE